ncbi:MAG TPA: aminotransferase class IV [Acidimicrobiales bacterium]|nr:aminotransferase class IV [Acidimicrobiales bacterium]
MTRVWIDGQLVPSEQATISVIAPGVQLGLGVFEALSVVEGEAFALTRHLRRLARSAEIVDLTVPFTDFELREAVAMVLAADPQATKVRITVSASPGDAAPAVVVNGVRRADWSATARVVLSPYVRNERSPSTGAKTTSYADNVLALSAARRTGADEALLCDSNGYLSEGTASNVFLAVDGELCTPSLANGGLGGMTRELLCEIIPVHLRDDITVAELRAAPEVFITSSTRGVHPVEHIDGVTVPLCPGPLTAAAAEAFAALRAHTLDP